MVNGGRLEAKDIEIRLCDEWKNSERKRIVKDDIVS